MWKTRLVNVVAVLAILVGGMMGLLMTPSTAHALCVTPAEEGAWVNYDSNTRGITRVNIRFQCQDQIHNGKVYPPGDPYYVHLYGACHPTDCDWGEAGATRQSGDWIRTTIDQGFATRYVWVKAYTGYSQEWLRVWIWTDFQDPNRADYAMNNWFNRP